jgi:hypothetical protein
MEKYPGEVLPPYHDARQQQAGETNDDRKVQKLLAAVVAADFRQVLFAVIDHILDLAQPYPVSLLKQVVAPELHAKQGKGGHHEAADEGMQDPRPGAAAEQSGQPKQRRMK